MPLNTIFQLDSLTTLEIGETVITDSFVPGAIGLIFRRKSFESVYGRSIVQDTNSDPVEPDAVMSCWIAPSQARAVASVLLSAATEAKNHLSRVTR